MAETFPYPAAVLDANAIIGLAKSESLALTPHLVAECAISPGAAGEVQDALSRTALRDALASWLRLRTPRPEFLDRLPAFPSPADREVLALSLQMRPCVLVTGDLWLSRRAAERSVPVLPAPALIQWFAVVGLIDRARPYLDRMIAQGFGIDPLLYGAILSTLGE
ncbi:MAG: hypothetical protein IT210_11870 [Armatimonadetes bacterium]|nr:hypothetical protein [Armatimonadota bacterium]